MCPVRYPGRALTGRAHREPHMSGQLLRVHRLCCFSDHKPKYTGCGLRSHTIYFNSLCFGPLWHSSISSCFWSFSLVFPLTTFLGPSGRLCPDLWACCVLQLWPRLGRSLRILLSPDPVSSSVSRWYSFYPRQCLRSPSQLSLPLFYSGSFPSYYILLLK